MVSQSPATVIRSAKAASTSEVFPVPGGPYSRAGTPAARSRRSASTSGMSASARAGRPARSAGLPGRARPARLARRPGSARRPGREQRPGRAWTGGRLGRDGGGCGGGHREYLREKRGGELSRRARASSLPGIPECAREFPVISRYTTTLSRLFRGSQRIPASKTPIPTHFVTHRHGRDYRPPSHLFAAAAPAFPSPSPPPPGTSRTSSRLAVRSRAAR